MAVAPKGLAAGLIGQASISSALARALALKGEQPQYIAPHYDLGITAFDLTDFDFRWLRRSPTWEVAYSVAGVAAQNSIATLGLPQGGGGTRQTLAVVEEIGINNQDTVNGQTVLVGIVYSSGGLATAPTGSIADDRVGAGASPGAALAAGATATAVAPTGRNYRLVPNGTLVIRGPWVLTAADNAVQTSRLEVYMQNVNVGLSGYFRWYERELLASER